jgi:acetyl-CoA carboxylase alpha subunit
MIQSFGHALRQSLSSLEGMAMDELLEARYQRLMQYGVYKE